MSARVTFGNINGLCEPVPHLSLKSEKIVECHDTVATPSTGTVRKLIHDYASNEFFPPYSTRVLVVYHPLSEDIKVILNPTREVLWILRPY